MKRCFYLLLIIVMLFSIFQVTVSATVNEFEYSITDNLVTITKYVGSDAVVEVPAEIDGYPVVTIGDNAFRLTTVSEVILPGSITSIGRYVFYGCINLESINIPASVVSIDSCAFMGCTKLESISIPSQVKKISASLFANCSNLQTVNLHDNIVEIGISAFSCCEKLSEIKLPHSIKEISALAFFQTNLQSIELPEMLLSIDYDAFGGVPLKTVNIPANVISIHSESFRNNNFLESITVSPENSYYKSEDGVLFSLDGREIIKYPIAKFGDVYKLPDSVEVVSDYAFEDTNLISVVFSSVLKSIGCYAFQNTPITSINVPDGVESIKIGAFKNCTWLNKISLPTSIKTLGSDVFKGTEYYNNPYNYTDGCLYIDNYLVDSADSSIILNGNILTPGVEHKVLSGTLLIADGGISNVEYLVFDDINPLLGKNCLPVTATIVANEDTLAFEYARSHYIKLLDIETYYHDINNDSVISVNDYQYLVNIALGSEKDFNEYIYNHADLNKDTAVDVLDCAYFALYCNGIIT